MVLSRMLPRWCSAARVSPSCAARVPCAQRSEVVHRVGEHAERLAGRLVEVGEERVVLGGGSALECGEQGEPAERGCAELAAARRWR